jgi:hypothetical protein
MFILEAAGSFRFEQAASRTRFDGSGGDELNFSFNSGAVVDDRRGVAGLNHGDDLGGGSRGQFCSGR